MDSDEPHKPGVHSTISESDILNSHVNVGLIEIEGCTRTRPEFVRRVLDQCLRKVNAAVIESKSGSGSKSGPGSYDPTSIPGVENGNHDPQAPPRQPLSPPLGDTLVALGEAVLTLESTQAFKGIDVFLHKPQDSTLEGEAQSESTNTNILVTVSEKDSLFQLQSKVDSSTSLDDAMMSASASVRNLFGSAESLVVKMGFGTKNLKRKASTSLDLTLTKPCLLHVDNTGTFRLFSRLLNMEQRSSYSIRIQGTEMELGSKFGTSVLSAQWRDVADLKETASLAVREDAGTSVKTSVSHSIVWDERDDPYMPTSGYLASLEAELAGLGLGNIRYFRTEAGTQYHIPIGPLPDTTFSVAGKVGSMIPFGSSKTHIHDRFFLGGPNSFRGFRTKGVGPHSGTDSLGGELFYTLFASLSLPVPRDSILRRWFETRIHLFGTVGDLITVDQFKETVQARLRSPFASTRASVGIGLVLQLPVGRLEINMCHVLRCTDADRIKGGLQVGLSHSFQ